MKASAAKIDTAMSEALYEAGYKTEQERLDGIVNAAWKRWPAVADAQKRYDYVVQCVQREQLTWFLVERTRQGLMKMLVLDLLRSHQPESYLGRRVGEGQAVRVTQSSTAPAITYANADHGRRGAGATQGPLPLTGTPQPATQPWQILRDEQLRARAQDTGAGGTSPLEAHSTNAPGSGQPRDDFAGKFAVRASLSKFDIFEIDGILVKFMTKAEVIEAQELEVGRARDHDKRSAEHRRKAAALAKLAAGMESMTETVDSAWRGARKAQAEKIIAAALTAEAA